MKAKQYILTRPVYNTIDFPIGTVVKECTAIMKCFEVVKGKLKGQRGGIADGLSGWVCDDTPTNRKLIKEYLNKVKEFNKQEKMNAKIINNMMNNIPKSKGYFKGL